MPQSEAIVFTELQPAYPLGGWLNVYDVVSRTCFRTPGKKPEEMEDLDCREIPSHLFGETIRGFVADWPREEMGLWDAFFTSQRTDSHNARTMSLQREGSSSIFKAEIIGKGDQVSDLTQKAFGARVVNGSPKEVEIYSQNRPVKYDDPLAVETCKHLPTGYKVSQVVAMSGVPISRHFLKAAK